MLTICVIDVERARRVFSDSFHPLRTAISRSTVLGQLCAVIAVNRHGNDVNRGGADVHRGGTDINRGEVYAKPQLIT